MATSPRASRAKSNVTPIADKPAPVAINLDTLELEKGNDVPFVAVIAGKRLTFTDPTEIPWQDLAGLENPYEFADVALEDEGERETFLETRVPVKKIQALMKAYRDHYGLGEAGNGDA